MNRFAEAPDRVAGSAETSTPSRDRLRSAHERHLTAVARSVGWARESAARGEYGDALGWIEVIEAIGDELSDDCQIERQAWRTALAAPTSGHGIRPDRPAGPAQVRPDDPSQVTGATAACPTR